MTKNTAFALVFVCLVFPFTCAAEESPMEPVESVQSQPDSQAGIKAGPSEGAGPVSKEDSAIPGWPVAAHADTDTAPAAECAGCAWLESAMPRLVGAQFNGVYQYMPSFRSPYQGPHSLVFTNNEGKDTTNTYGVYFGSQLARNLQLYVDVELFQGNGVSDGLGLAGYVNGDVIRAGSSNLPKVPYLARYYFRYFIPLSSETEKVERCQDQLPGEQPVSRWEIKFGRLALADDFDQNRYANNNRTQFMNYDFLFNTAWDYAADTRGYSVGVVTSLFEPRWKLAFGVFMLPNTQNGAQFDYFDTEEFGYNLELTVKPNDAGTVVRLLTYFNEGRMGDYDQALALGQATHTVPDILLVEETGGRKYGCGLNFEQPLADDGETGIFGRLGWNDGNHESWEYVESDRHASLGAQISGVHWCGLTTAWVSPLE